MALTSLRNTLQRQPWWPRPGNGFDIADWLDQADAQASLAERHIWLIRLVDWLRRGEPVSGAAFVLHLIGQQPERRARVVALLATLWRDVDVAALLADYGFAPRTSFLSELGERLRRRLMPLSPDTTDLGTLFDLIFDHPDDATWVAALDEPTLDALGALWTDAMAAASASMPAANTPALGWREPFFDAMLYLATQIRATGFSPAFRSRMGVRVDADFDALPTSAEQMHADASVRQAFRQLARVTERLHELAQTHAAAAPHESWPPAVLQEAQYLRALLDACAQGAQGLHGHLEEHGISVDLVFQIDQLCERCHRLARLLDVVLSPQPGADLRGLLLTLVQVGGERRSIRNLVAQHHSQLARKVAERSAETGEHYITRTRAEYWDMLQRAAGGGLVLAGTTFMKFAVFALGLSPFWTGLGAGLNYAASFVLVQWLHFTVATKQPAMTAPAMAAKLANTRDEAAIEGFVDEVAHLVRSQVAGIVGNLAVVAPVVLGIQGLAWWLSGRPLISEAEAHYVLHSLSLWGPTAWYAAFTGVLLFASSLLAGWAENAFVLHRLDSALRWNPRVQAWLGPARAARWAGWWRDNVSGLAANISLGLMLGLVPMVATFMALPLDVRHVTLSTGQIAAAVGTLGPAVWHDPALWWCVAAIPVTGLLNVGVSFVLALRVAVRSRNVRVGERARLWGAIRHRLLRRPVSFFWPARS